MKICKIAFLSAMFLYVCAASIPARWVWFEPGEVVFEDTTVGTAAHLVYSRHVKRPTMIQYSVVVRDAVTNEPACEGRNGPYEYQPVQGPVVGRNLVWWAAGDTRCQYLPPGDYWVQTTWRIATPLRALLPAWARGTILDSVLPPKTITRDSPAFSVKPRA